MLGKFSHIKGLNLRCIYKFLFGKIISIACWTSPNNLESQNMTISQTTNNFLFKNSDHKTIISSLDGLNIYDGLNTKHLNSSNQILYGNNIQSNFYEDNKKNIWFTTYEALHVYNPKKDIITYFFIAPTKKDTIKNDYKIIKQIGDTLLIAADKNLYLFDVRTKSQVMEIPVNLTGSPYQCLNYYNKKWRLIATFYNKISSVDFSNDFNIISKKSIPLNALSVRYIDNSKYLIGTTNGDILIYNSNENKIEYENKLYQNGLVQGLCKLNNETYLISSKEENLYLFNVLNYEVIDSINIKNPKTLKNYTNFIIPYLDKDSILWIGVNGYGIVNKDLKKEKYRHILQSKNKEENINVTGISESNFSEKYAVSTRGNGLYLLNNNFEKINLWKDIPYSFNLSWLNESEIIFNYSKKIQVVNVKTKKINTVCNSPPKEFFYSLEKLKNDEFLITTKSNNIYLLNLNRGKYLKKILNNHQDSTPFLGLKIDKNKNVFISKNEVELWMCKFENEKLTYNRALNIPGGILCLIEPTFDPIHWYISNTNGIYKVNKKTYSIEKLKDEKGLLSQTIYVIVEDQHQNFWLSSNQGIIKYNPTTKYIHGFTMADGLQGMEFNTNAYMKSKSGEIWMGGVNGLNVFHPDKVKLSTTKATVCIDEIMLADQATKVFGVPDYVDKMNVDYGTPFSIYFHAIDYGDIEAARLKYKLIGSDKDYVFVNEFKSNIRYTSLRPGSYTLQILAANSDGIWNPTPKTIAINVLPPFWMTWWFITLAVLSTIAIIYYLVKSYYKRKIEKQNQILREQNLIIASQKALEAERSRIASEMHDDLGSGLTRIKFLSDKAISQISDEKESAEIKKIATYSNELIRNMGEIIWAMNTRFDNNDNLIAYIRHYASEYLQEHNIALAFENQCIDETFVITGEKRRNVFLVMKELLHNAVKYSGAPSIQIIFACENQGLKIILNEIGGRGFDFTAAQDKGNGLYNIQKRLKSIGTIAYERSAQGMHIVIDILP